jgi:hypothetical protein
LSERSAYLRNPYLKTKPKPQVVPARLPARPTPPTLPFLQLQIVKEQRPKPRKHATKPKQKPTKPNQQDPAKSTNCQELRSQNPVASDVAAVDERVIRTPFQTVNSDFAFF